MVITLEKHRGYIETNIGINHINGKMTYIDGFYTGRYINMVLMSKYGIKLNVHRVPAYIIDFIVTIDSMDKWVVEDEDTYIIEILQRIYEEKTGKSLDGLLGILEPVDYHVFRTLLSSKILGRNTCNG